MNIHLTKTQEKFYLGVCTTYRRMHMGTWCRAGNYNLMRTVRALAAKEGIFCGVSSGGAVAGALALCRELDSKKISEAVIVAIICDRGDRYLSTGVFDAALS